MNRASNHASSYYSPPTDQRVGQAPLHLVQLDPQAVVDGVRNDSTYLADEILTCGTMRETCPVCAEGHLQLVLRQKSVRVPHLFCLECTRCFGAFLDDGSPALIE
jgi:hypothetical protein